MKKTAMTRADTKKYRRVIAQGKIARVMMPASFGAGAAECPTDNCHCRGTCGCFGDNDLRVTRSGQVGITFVARGRLAGRRARKALNLNRK